MFVVPSSVRVEQKQTGRGSFWHRESGSVHPALSQDWRTDDRMDQELVRVRHRDVLIRNERLLVASILECFLARQLRIGNSLTRLPVRVRRFGQLERRYVSGATSGSYCPYMECARGREVWSRGLHFLERCMRRHDVTGRSQLALRLAGLGEVAGRLEVADSRWYPKARTVKSTTQRACDLWKSRIHDQEVVLNYIINGQSPRRLR